MLAISYGVRQLAAAISCDSLLSLSPCGSSLWLFLHRRLTVKHILGDSKLSPYQSEGKPPHSKEQSGQAQGLPLPWLPPLALT
ncbi:MAG: hypothetical protein ACUVQH_12830, partial [Thermogutta sp.]